MIIVVRWHYTETGALCQTHRHFVDQLAVQKALGRLDSPPFGRPRPDGGLLPQRTAQTASCIPIGPRFVAAGGLLAPRAKVDAGALSRKAASQIGGRQWGGPHAPGA